MGKKLTKEEMDRDIDIQIMKTERQYKGGMFKCEKSPAYTYTAEDMKQSKKLSLFEVLASTIFGLGIALWTQIIVFPLFDIHTTPEDNYLIACIFTLVSIVRGYCVRRFFNLIPGRF